MKSHQNRDSNKDIPLQLQLDHLTKTYYDLNPFTKDVKKNYELEVKFGTRGYQTAAITKIHYDNVIKKIKSLGFVSENETGDYMLRIETEFLDSKTGRFKQSNVRTEINGFLAIQEYCKLNDVNKIISNPALTRSTYFIKKERVYLNDSQIRDVDFSDFHFRVSLRSEDNLGIVDRNIRNMIDNWEKIKKTLFRYINRVSFTHPDFPIHIDISIVKSSKTEGQGRDRRFVKVYRMEESGVFDNMETYEIELEVDNSRIGPGTEFNSPEKIAQAIRKVTKFVLSGLQGTNYPISYKDQKNVLNGYMSLLHKDEFVADDPKKGRIYNSHFLGPSSYTLQMLNIVALDANVNTPNIRKDFLVTEKADGERHLLYINSHGKIYLINTNMNVVFTGSVTTEKDLFDSLIDGELVLHNKLGDFINLYLAFDIYYVQKKDIRAYGFVPIPSQEDKTKTRYSLLKHVFRNLNASSIVKGEMSPMRFESKNFEPKNPANSIFSACGTILKKVKDGLFEYNTDGLIFTPAFLGVGGDAPGKVGPLKKKTWEYSFKWKPAEFNTIDFYITTIKTQQGEDKITSIFEDGMNTAEITQLNQYKTIVLRCGFSQRDHGYINPCQDVLDDKLPIYGDVDNENAYEPIQFYPTEPYDPSAGICNIMLRKDDSGVNQMFTEENQVFEDNTIVEFRYDLGEEDGKWRWKPLRVRYDKTAELRQGISKNYGNAYNVANSNWKSIHNPITENMITSGANIPDLIGDENVYYNKTSGLTRTRALRDFHNLYVKKILITGSAKSGDTLIDYACGKGGDFPKWIRAGLSFVFGIDFSKDNLENQLDGACARFLNYRKEYKHVPYALFVNGDSRANVRSGRAMLNDKALQITKAVFGEGTKEVDGIGKAVVRQYGKGQDGFNISSCQFAIHYFFENQEIFQNFMINISECTKLGGYFIGTSYDGKVLFNLLKSKAPGDGIEIIENGQKIWEVKKQYVSEHFEDDISCLGYKIDVFQESINKSFSEFLVNYDYLNRVMEDYGFQLIQKDEAHEMGLPEASGLFSELFVHMLDEVKRNKMKEKEYGKAPEMNVFEKKISFLNRYFVYKKIRNVNAAKVELESMDESEVNRVNSLVETKNAVSIAKKAVKENKPKIKKLDKKILLEPSSLSEPVKPVKQKKQVLILEEEDDE